MRIKSWTRFIALLAAVALAIPAMAKPVSKSINVVQPAKISGAQLTVGEYRLLIDGNKVTVRQGKHILAQAEGRWEERAEKARNDSMVLGPNREVQEIRFAGDHRVLVIMNPH